MQGRFHNLPAPDENTIMEEVSHSTLATLTISSIRDHLVIKSKEFNQQQHQLQDFLAAIENQIQYSKKLLEDERGKVDEQRRRNERVANELRQKQQELEKQSESLKAKISELRLREKRIQDQVIILLFR
jgi:hypothetical protein